MKKLRNLALAAVAVLIGATLNEILTRWFNITDEFWHTMIWVATIYGAFEVLHEGQFDEKDEND